MTKVIDSQGRRIDFTRIANISPTGAWVAEQIALRADRRYRLSTLTNIERNLRYVIPALEKAALDLGQPAPRSLADLSQDLVRHTQSRIANLPDLAESYRWFLGATFIKLTRMLGCRSANRNPLKKAARDHTEPLSEACQTKLDQSLADWHQDFKAYVTAPDGPCRPTAHDIGMAAAFIIRALGANVSVVLMMQPDSIDVEGRRYWMDKARARRPGTWVKWHDHDQLQSVRNVLELLATAQELHGTPTLWSWHTLKANRRWNSVSTISIDDHDPLSKCFRAAMQRIDQPNTTADRLRDAKAGELQRLGLDTTRLGHKTPNSRVALSYLKSSMGLARWDEILRAAQSNMTQSGASA
ncbi:hypothetical protein ACFSM5_21215 [Lacibacterium aquatile]|uniref:Integrase n=1 Tax=Lacibacterium aquatile TaxID=1168082 RepID=A0ABW5DYC2_9PROT